MSQMCPNCSFDNHNDAQTCARCPSPLRGLLGAGTVLNKRYQVASVLGYGAMGAVYLTDDQRLVGRRCAIKENRPNTGVSADVQAQSREQFLAEAHILARLDHPNLPKVSDYFIEGGQEYLVMDYVEGEDLDNCLQRAKEPLSEALVLGWADQVLDALTYLHNQRPQPIVHRDIKPANLRVNLQNRVKLVDFGLVKLFDSDNPATKVELRGLGTPAYAPLEQFADSQSHTDTRSDIYSLGATMYHLLTHLYPPDVHQRVLNPETLIPPRQLNAKLSDKAEQVVLRAMAVHPDDRYQTAEEMRQAITEVIQGAAGVKVSAQQAAGIPVLLWIFGLTGLAMVLLILGGIAYILFNRVEQSETPTQQPATVVQEQSAEAAPTEVVLQTPGDAPTNIPTPVVKATAVINETPKATDTPVDTATPTPTPEPTFTPKPTTAPPVSRVQGIPASTLTGIIAYPVFNGVDYDIYFGRADGSGTEFFLAHASQPAFSPDGTQIAFHSWKLDTRGLMISDISGANQKLVAGYTEDQLPTWSVDGSEVILLSRRAGHRKSQLYRVNSDEERTEGIIFSEGEYPAIGPNGQLVFRGWGNTGPGLRLASASFNNIQPLTDIEHDTAPAISPDGQKIAFMSRRDENWEIYVINTDGSGLQRLTDDRAEDGLPAWSPDGRALAFASNRGGTWAIWAMTPNGHNQQQLFVMEGSPDGFVGADTYASRGWAEERISWKK